jgi:hypothetical protein
MTIMQYRADQVVSVQLTFHHSETLNSLHPKLLLYVWRIVSAARETAEGAGRGGLLNSSFSEEEESVGAILQMRRWWLMRRWMLKRAKTQAIPAESEKKAREFDELNLPFAVMV